MPSANVLTYAAPPKRAYRRINALALIASLIFLGAYYIGLLPETSFVSFNFLPEFAYDQTVPPTEVFSVVLRVPPLRLLEETRLYRELWFFPSAAVVLVAFVLFRHIRLKVATALVAIFLPLLIFEPQRAALASLMSLVVVPAFLGLCDGETWCEGIVTYGAVGGWTLLWFVVLILTQRTADPA